MRVEQRECEVDRQRAVEWKGVSHPCSFTGGRSGPSSSSNEHHREFVFVSVCQGLQSVGRKDVSCLCG